MLAELKREPAVRDAQIGVEVKNGVVTLAGEVSSYTKKWKAERAAQRVNGVKALAVEMKVKLSEFDQRQAAKDGVRYLMGVTDVSDQIGIKPSVIASAVEADIEAALKRTSIADAKQISVAVRGSDATLSGTVHRWDERDTASNSAWGAPGVRNVVDMVTLSY